MKPFTKNLIAGFIGALVATVLLFSFGRPWIGDDTGDDAEYAQKENNIRERVYAYFDDHNISCVSIDSIATRFTYKGLTYVFLYDSVKNDKFIHIWTSFSLKEDGEDSVPDDARRAAFVKASRIQERVTYVMTSVDDDCIYFSVEQYVAPGMDMGRFMSCMLEVLDYSTDLYCAESYYSDEENGGE